ncbi:MAG: FxLYD domain-containing protein [Dehalococcoidia bacterium]|nr:FxLYD domain-containing protein [Dehalococcoidia bacterium]
MKKLLVPLLALIGIVAGGCIIQFSTLYVDDVSRTHFVGLASNLTNADVVSASVEVKFFDSSNNLLATEFVSPCTRTLQAHQSSPVESIIPKGVTAKRTETVVHPMTFGDKMVPDLDFKNIKVEKDGTVTHLKGEVKNSDNETFYAVQVCAAFYDDDDDVVRVGRAYLDPAKLSEDATGAFDIAIADMPADTEEYQIWVDATIRSPTDVTAPVVEGPEEMPGVATATPTVTGTPAPTSTPTITPTPG